MKFIEKCDITIDAPKMKVDSPNHFIQMGKSILQKRGGSYENPQSMFKEVKENNAYPCKPQYHYKKGGINEI